jgi:hypothetical protein
VVRGPVSPSARYTSAICSQNAQSNGNFREPVVRSLTYAIADVATGALEPRKAGVKGICNAKRENMICTSVRVTLESWRLSYVLCLISLQYVCTRRGGDAGFPKHHKNYILPYNASTAMVAACCRPTSPSASFDGKDR